jgi:hypothetical protein
MYLQFNLKLSHTFFPAWTRSLNGPFQIRTYDLTSGASTSNFVVLFCERSCRQSLNGSEMFDFVDMTLAENQNYLRPTHWIHAFYRFFLRWHTDNLIKILRQQMGQK